MKTILRFEKIKTYQQLNLSNAHIQRYLDTPNADNNKKNFHIYGSKNLVKSVKTHFKKKGIKPRKNSVLCMEAILTLSPEFFENQFKTRDFAKAAYEFLKENFGDNLKSVTIHLDESTPHIHAHILPITDDGRLSARDLFNKLTLESFQEIYCKTMSEKIGNQFEYEKGSKAKHQDLDKFYTKINEQKKEHEELQAQLFKEKENNLDLKDEIKHLKVEMKNQQEEISNLKKYINKLKKAFKKLKSSFTKKSNDEYELTKLTFDNFPDLKLENKNKRRNRPRY